ncbi:hypothetical protein LCGC14_0972230 [marine sediment metagenome]|uniref:Uncharacterized protein n=1 Tax=marine sediment metagenome TaxID=412755 RepID=A0A0F9RHR1_9ZZZZ
MKRNVILFTLFMITFAGVSQAATTTGTVSIHNNTFMQYVVNTTGSLAFEFCPAIPVVLLETRFTLSASGGAGNFTATLDNGTTSTLDVNMRTVDMTSASSVHWIPVNPIILKASDVMDFAYPNANLKTYGLEVVYRRL